VANNFNGLDRLACEIIGEKGKSLNSKLFEIDNRSMIYGNILASTYNLYGRFNNQAPYESSVLYTSACEMLLVLFSLSMLKLFTNYDPFKAEFLTNTVAIILIGLLMIGNFMFYSKKRVVKIVEKYNTKTKAEKRIWGTIAIVNFILPLILFPFLFKK